MTDRIAIVLGGIVLLAVLANFAFGWGLEVALGRRMADTIDWLAFWR